MIEATNTFNSSRCIGTSRLLSILQSKAGERWDRALEELEGKRLHVEGSFPQFAVTNKSGTRYDVTLDAQGNGTCTCPDFQVRTSREGRLCKHVAAAAISSLVPLIPSPRSAPVSPSPASQSAPHPAEAATFVLRLRKKIQGEGKDGVEIEVAGKLTGDQTGWNSIFRALSSWVQAPTGTERSRSSCPKRVSQHNPPNAGNPQRSVRRTPGLEESSAESCLRLECTWIRLCARRGKPGARAAGRLIR